MGNAVGAVFGIVMLLAGIVLVGVAFAVPEVVAGYVVVIGILLIAGSITLPVWVLDKLES